MALEKDQERPTSPGGSRKIKPRNFNYILDMGKGFNNKENVGGEHKKLGMKGQEMLRTFSDSPSAKGVPSG